MAIKILVVEDQPNAREIYTMLLNLEGYKVIHAKNGKVGDKKAKEKRPDLIFTDLNMPKMNGYECLNAIKKENKFSHIPIIIFTTSKFEAERIHSMNMDSTFFLSKPGDYALLKAELTKILNKIIA